MLMQSSRREFIGLLRRQKIGVKKHILKILVIGGMPATSEVNLGVNFLGWPETLEKQGEKISRRIRCEIGGNLPKISQPKLENSTQIRFADLGIKSQAPPPTHNQTKLAP